MSLSSAISFRISLVIFCDDEVPMTKAVLYERFLNASGILAEKFQFSALPQVSLIAFLLCMLVSELYTIIMNRKRVLLNPYGTTTGS